VPKFTDLPVAISIKDNDILAISDPDAGESRQIDVQTFRAVSSSREVTYGSAGQGILLGAGDILSPIIGYVGQLPDPSPAIDKGLGEITIIGNTTGLVKITIFMHMFITDPSNADNNISLYLRKDRAGVLTDILTNKLFTTANSLDTVAFNCTLIISVVDGDILTIMASSSDLSKTVNILQSSFIKEDA